MAIDKTEGWAEKLKSSEDIISDMSPDWEQMYKYFRGIPPREPDGGLNRANLHVHITHPIIMTYLAHILMYFFSDNIPVTGEIYGDKDEASVKEMNGCIYDSFKWIYADPSHYLNMRGIILNALIYGNCGVKVMPVVPSKANRYKLIKTLPVEPWNFFYEPLSTEWDEVGWASHQKMVSEEHILKYYGKDALKKCKEGKLSLDKRFYSKDVKGYVINEIQDKNKLERIVLADRKQIISKAKFKQTKFDFQYKMAVDLPEANRIPGIGEAELSQDNQITANVFRNQRIDNATRALYNFWYVNSMAVDTTALEESRAGGILTGPPQGKPEQLITNDVTRSLEYDQERFWIECQRTVGAIDPLMGQGVSKRQTAVEAQLMQANANARFWDKMKCIESTFLIPWGEKAISYLKDAPDEFFTWITGKKKNVYPKELKTKKYDIRVQAKASQEVKTNVEKRRIILEAIDIVSTIWPEDVRSEKLKELIIESYKYDAPGLASALKSMSIEPNPMELAPTGMTTGSGRAPLEVGGY